MEPRAAGPCSDFFGTDSERILIFGPDSDPLDPFHADSDRLDFTDSDRIVSLYPFSTR